MSDIEAELDDSWARSRILPLLAVSMDSLHIFDKLQLARCDSRAWLEEALPPQRISCQTNRVTNDPKSQLDR